MTGASLGASSCRQGTSLLQAAGSAPGHLPATCQQVQHVPRDTWQVIPTPENPVACDATMATLLQTLTARPCITQIPQMCMAIAKPSRHIWLSEHMLTSCLGRARVTYLPMEERLWV